LAARRSLGQAIVSLMRHKDRKLKTSSLLYGDRREAN
jgi:hypothetical protein